ncbi:IS4 family transposase [Paraglaciecola sp.]|uniref:IS4 family transposase n=1 Tax=Paraglaciecola sp. TaxID=1920173 RepID=UPI003263556B
MKVLSDLFTLDSSVLDPRITTSLFTAAKSVVNGSALALTALGRNVASDNGVIEKHCIKRVDRLLGNPRLHGVIPQYYQIIQKLFITEKRPLIHVDWSTVYNYDFVMLRAAISIKGRAITLYEEVHPEEQHAQPAVHKKFLAALAKLLPADCEPIICTDAGFKIPWFKEVQRHNWYWLARTRGTVKCKFETEEEWHYVSHCHAWATSKATELPPFALSKSSQYSCRGVLFKGKNQQRHNLNRKGVVTKDNINKRHSKSAKEPWFLVSNLPETQYPPHQLVSLYKRRMAIEESFRDCKNEYYGLGLSRSLSRCEKRLQVILLVAMMVQFYLYCVGKAAENQGYHLHFQANTITNRRVLSYGYLGLRIIKHRRYDVLEQMILDAIKALVDDAKCS